MKTSRYILFFTCVFSLITCISPEFEPSVSTEKGKTENADAQHGNTSNNSAESSSAEDDNSPQVIEKPEIPDTENPDTSSEEVEEALPPAEPMSTSAILQSIRAYGTEKFHPVTRQNRPSLVSHDLNDDGYNDICALFIESDNVELAQFKTISNFSRLFDEESEPVPFFLQVFIQDRGKLKPTYRQPLGKQFVFSEMHKIDIRRGYGLPIGVSVSFQTLEGNQTKLITFTNGKPSSRLTLKDSHSSSYRMDDIDKNGYVDIIVRDKGMEEGAGFETFLSWYSWSGNKYEKRASTNIVRNFRDYLSTALSFIKDRKWEDFLSYAMDPRVLQQAKQNGLSQKAVIENIFKPMPEGQVKPFSYFFKDEKEIFKIVHQEILENPFPIKNNTEPTIQLSFRFITADNQSLFYSARIYLTQNPFIPPQFSFLLSQ